MAGQVTPTTTMAIKATAQSALQANKDHQYALKVYTERLEAELETVDRLIVRRTTYSEEKRLD